jgi:hypothetical protein
MNQKLVEELVGLTIISPEKDVLLITESKKFDSEYPIYLFNITKGIYTCNIFIKNFDDSSVSWNYNEYHLEEREKRYYEVNYNLINHKYDIKFLYSKDINDTQYYLLEDKYENRIVRRYKQI